MRGSGDPIDAFRVSMSSAVSTSSQEEYFGDVFMWGEGINDGFLGGQTTKINSASGGKNDALDPKALQPASILDVQNISCGWRHAVLVTKQGELFSWGEGSGGKLGHGVDCDVSEPKLVEALVNIATEIVSCGEFHTCAVSVAGDLYTWGDGTHNIGLLGHGNDYSHWMPKRVDWGTENLCVSSIACGPWHTALVTSAGQLFTFGDGTFGVLGHNDTKSAYTPREVESLKGLRTVRAACGPWHTAAVVEVMVGYSSSCSGKLFTWGDGDEHRLGHGDKVQRLVPTCVAAVVDYNFKQVACGHSLTVALTTSGQVFTMGSPSYGQLGDLSADGRNPCLVEGKLCEKYVDEIACGAYHVAVLTHKTEVYTWGKGAHGRLGHGDVEDRYTPTLVETLKDKQVKSIACGAHFTAAICLHKQMSEVDQSYCSGCRLPFGFTRKRHHCYNCGQVFCHSCSSKKILRASLAPSPIKPYRVCEPCFGKVKKAVEAGSLIAGNQAKKNDQKLVSDVKEKLYKPEPKDSRAHLPTPALKPIADQSKLPEGKIPPRRLKKLELSSSRVSPAPIGLVSWGGVDIPPTFNSGLFQPILSAASGLQSRTTTSTVATPLLMKSSRPRSTTPTPTVTGLIMPKAIIDDLKKTNQALTEDNHKLQAQVETLTKLSQSQERDLQRLTQEVRESMGIAREEAAKSRAAKELIKSLTAQLKDMAERLPPGIVVKPPSASFLHSTSSGTYVQADTIEEAASETAGKQSFCKSYELSSSMIMRDACRNGGTSPHISGVHKTSESDMNGPDAQQNEDTVNASNPVVLDNARDGDKGWVEQDEPGVYITLIALPGGGKDLKRVRFSRKRFSERQAEQWWAENRQRVHEQYNVRGIDRQSGSVHAPIRSGEEERDR